MERLTQARGLALKILLEKQVQQIPMLIQRRLKQTFLQLRRFILGLFFFGGGINLSPKTNHTLTASGQTATSSTSDSAAPIFGLEGVFRFNSNFGLGAIFESSSYKYSSGGGSDSHLAFLLMPRIGFGSKFKAWAGVGLGLMISGIKGGSDTSGSISLKASDQTTSSFDLSPRLGASYNITDRIALELMGAYTAFSGNVSATLSNPGSADIIIADHFTRNWMTLMFRVGVEF